jgi:hypothetical protein
VDGVAMENDKVQAILSWPFTSNVQAVLGLHKVAFKWCSEAEDTFHTLQRALMTTPVLQLPAFNREFVVECDASGFGFGVVLHQGEDDVAFFSHLIVPQHAKLAAYEHDLIGLVQVVQHWRSYLWERPFLLHTDHFSLKFLLDQCLSTIPQH